MRGTAGPSGPSYLIWPANEWMTLTLHPHNITQQVLLTIVSCQNADLVSRVAQQPHEHVDCYNVLSFSQVLIVVWHGFRLPSAIVVRYIDQLVVVAKTWVASLEGRVLQERQTEAESLLVSTLLAVLASKVSLGNTTTCDMQTVLPVPGTRNMYTRSCAVVWHIEHPMKLV